MQKMLGELDAQPAVFLLTTADLWESFAGLRLKTGR